MPSTTVHASRSHDVSVPDPTRLRRSDIVAALGVAAALVAAGLGALAIVRSQGVTITGDEPHYLVAALAIGRFHTVTVARAYAYAVAHQLFIHWPPAPTGWQAVSSHGHLFAYHELGLPFLLAVPVAVDGARGANVAVVVLAALLVAWLALLMGRLSSTTSAWRLAGAGVFLMPASLLASTQIFPDLLSGLAMAVVVLTVALIEKTGRSSWAQLVACGVLLGYLPWLHIQNALFVLVLAAALGLVHWRHRLRLAPLLVAAVIAAACWALMAAYNSYVFSQWQGPGGVTFTWGATTWTRILALLVDRQQGLLVQFPLVVLAVAALWVFRRSFPVAAAATAGVVIAVLVLSGASTNSFGGASFVGRFDWAAFPVLLAFAGLYLVELRHRRPAAGLAVAIVAVALCVLQAVPVLEATHAYYSTTWFSPSPPGGPGWWGPLDRILPSFAQLVPAWRSPRVVWEVLLVIVFVALLVVASVRLLAGGRTRRRVVGRTAPIVLAVASAVTLGGTAASAAQVMVPMAVRGVSLPTQVGHADGGAQVVTGGPPGWLSYGPFWTLPAGRYRATVGYSLDDPSPAAAVAEVTVTRTSPPGTTRVVAKASLRDTAGGKATLRFVLPFPGLLQVRVRWSGTGTAAVRSLEVDQGR